MIQHLSRLWLICLLISLGTELAAQDADRGNRRPSPEDRLLDNLFRAPRNVQLTAQQQAKLEELRRKHRSKLDTQLDELREKNLKVYTPQQVAARSQALRSAREAGKSPREQRELSNAAMKLTAEQQTRLADIQRQRRDLLASIRQQVNAIVGDRRNTRGPAQRAAPTAADVQYGPHARNVLDFWQAKSEKPTPVLVSIHGGGFRGGNKSVNRELLRQCLDEDISVVAITYRLSDEAIAPAQFRDCARAIQFIRSKASAWNLDPTRVAATGGSAGAGLSLWLGFHDDLANPDSDDPIQHQSTRLSGMYVNNGQTSYDPRFIRDLFPGKDTYQHPALAQLFDADLQKLDELPKDKYELFELVSSINHLTKDDPPAILTYSRPLEAEVTNQSIGIHHPQFGVVLKEKMDQLGIRCEVNADGKRTDGGSVTSTINFIKQVFGM